VTRRLLIAAVSILLTGTLVWARCAGCLPADPVVAERTDCCGTSQHCPEENVKPDCPDAAAAFEAESKVDVKPPVVAGQLELTSGDPLDASLERPAERIADRSPPIDLPVLYSTLLI